MPGEADIAAEIFAGGQRDAREIKKNNDAREPREWTRKSSLDLDSFVLIRVIHRL